VRLPAGRLSPSPPKEKALPRLDETSMTKISKLMTKAEEQAAYDAWQLSSPGQACADTIHGTSRFPLNRTSVLGRKADISALD